MSPADAAAHFKANGTLVPRDVDYQAVHKGGFAEWKLEVGPMPNATFVLFR